jgi:hypothetical protein
MTQTTKDAIAIAFWLLVLIGFMIYFGRSEKVQAKVDQILGCQDQIYKVERARWQGGV